MTYPHGGAAQVYRDLDDGGQIYRPRKEQIRNYLTRLEGFDTVADLLADESLEAVPGEFVFAETYHYVVADPSAVDHHIETAGGVKLYVQIIGNVLNAVATGFVADGVIQPNGTVTTLPTDQSAALQAAINTGAPIIELPAGLMMAGEVELSGRGQTLRGAGIDETYLIGTGAFCIQMGNLSQTFERIHYYPRVFNEVVQDATSTTPFLRIQNRNNPLATITGANIRDCKFENVRAAAIEMVSPMRESKIVNNDFRRMGSNTVATITGNFANSVTDHANNNWIEGNRFLGAAAPFIDMRAPAGIGTGKNAVSSWWISDNLFHAQTLNSTGNVSPVQAEPTDMVSLQGFDDLKITGNTFRSPHGDHAALKVWASSLQPCGTLYASHNIVEIDDNGSYTGTCLDLEDVRESTIINNKFRAGFQANDIEITESGTHSFNGYANVVGNTSQSASDVAVSFPSGYALNKQTRSEIEHTFIRTTDIVVTGGIITPGPDASGQVSMTGGATTATVTFAEAKTTSNYTVTLGPNQLVMARVTARSTTGFTIEISSNPGSTNVDWQVMV